MAFLTPDIPSNAFVALAAAAAWGGGDFSGGMGVKAAGGTIRGALRLILAAHALSVLVLLGIVFAQHDHLPHGIPLFWGLGAGVSVGFSLTAFYIALAKGEMGSSAAISGLLAAAIPVAVSIAVEGAPRLLQIAGFLLAGIAIWVIATVPQAASDSGVSKPNKARQPMALAIFGGVGFGVYFVALRQANSLGVVEPMALARLASVLTCSILLIVAPRERHLDRGSSFLSKGALLWAVGVAVLDTGGNLLFIAATRMGRLDVAAVLASLYPASTIMLAAWQLHERPTKRQSIGMVLALAAVVIITFA